MGQSDNQVQDHTKRKYDEIKSNPNLTQSFAFLLILFCISTIGADGSAFYRCGSLSEEECHQREHGVQPTPLFAPAIPPRFDAPDDKGKHAIAEPAKLRCFDDNFAKFLKEHHYLLIHLKQLLGHEKMAEFGEEMAGLGSLLMLMAPNSQWETIAEKIRDGAIKLKEGKRLVKEGHKLLRDAGSDMPTFVE
ncbi:hypothetical protein RJ641_024619 [Dillenia turbinata]|uniref:Uncharacterized protein n=1 Tax=Dillenia turbinata TaxID=194707 RepID=A0AAN8ZN46_9MAGN